MKLSDQPKSLLDLGDENPISRHIRIFSSLGVTQFYIVTGYLSCQIQDSLQHCEWDVSVSFIENTEWRRGNGISVLKVEPYISGDFYMTMADHAFDARIVGAFYTQCRTPLDTSVLAIDVPGPHNTHIDVTDVTKVKRHGDMIRAIGKDLSEYDAYDTGLFFCKSHIFSALRESLADGDESLSGGVTKLCQSDKMRSVLIPKKHWFDMDTPEDASVAMRFFNTSNGS